MRPYKATAGLSVMIASGPFQPEPILHTCEGHLQAMVVVHHGSDSIKAVAIKLVLVNPPSGI